MEVVAFLAYAVAGVGIGAAAGVIARQMIVSPFAAAVAAVVAAAAVSAAVSKVLLAMLVAMTVAGPSSVERKFVAAMDASASELMPFSTDLVVLYFVGVLIIAPFVAALSVLTTYGDRLDDLGQPGR